MGDQFSCETCRSQACQRPGDAEYPAFCPSAALSDEMIASVVGKIKNNRKLSKISLISAEVEGQFYGRLTRVGEMIEFIKRYGAKKIGIASCVGLLNETRLLIKIFDKYEIVYYVVGCKVGAVDKSLIGISDENKLNRGAGHESMCNPIMQAELLNAEGTDINIIMGLCVGHDMLFTMHSKAPVTTLVVKDRVLQHNPCAALYGSEGMYSRFK